MYWNDDDDPIDEAEYSGVKLNLESPWQVMSKKFKVYSLSKLKGNVVKVNLDKRV